MRDQFREKMEALISKRDLVAIVPKRKSILGRKKHVNHMRLPVKIKKNSWIIPSLVLALHLWKFQVTSLYL